MLPRLRLVVASLAAVLALIAVGFGLLSSSRSSSVFAVGLRSAQGSPVERALPEPPDRYVPDRMRANGVSGLQISHRHALHVAQLPTHHRDPFDRLLIAQAQLDGLTILTSDRMFEEYDVEVERAD